MKTWYRWWANGDIQTETVSRWTDKSVMTSRGYMYRRKLDGCGFCPTLEEAEDAILAEASRNVANAEKVLELCKSTQNRLNDKIQTERERRKNGGS